MIRNGKEISINYSFFFSSSVLTISSILDCSLLVSFTGVASFGIDSAGVAVGSAIVSTALASGSTVADSFRLRSSPVNASDSVPNLNHIKKSDENPNG